MSLGSDTKPTQPTQGLVKYRSKGKREDKYKKNIEKIAIKELFLQKKSKREAQQRGRFTKVHKYFTFVHRNNFSNLAKPKEFSLLASKKFGQKVSSSQLQEIFLIKMEMNPYKPLVQFCEGLYKKKLYIKTSINYFNLKIVLAKTTS